MFNSLTQAAKDTGSIFIMGWAVNWLSNKIQKIGLNAEQHLMEHFLNEEITNDKNRRIKNPIWGCKREPPFFLSEKF